MYNFNAKVIKELVKDGLNVSVGESDYKINNLYIEKQGKPWYIVSGEFQYSRYDCDKWEEEILKIKAGGVNVIATYSFWNHHEYKKGDWNFSGDMDLKRFVFLCQKHDMKVIMRMGPYCHGEVIYGGFPKYVFFNFRKRSNNKKYLSYVKTLYTKYYEQISEFLCTSKKDGCIIGMQLDNEFTGHYDHILNLKNIAIEVGFKLPIYTVTAWSGLLPESEVLPLSGGYPEAPWTQNLKPLPNEDRFKILPVYIDGIVGNDSGELCNDSQKSRTVRILNKMPYGMCELGAGVQVTKHRRPIISAKDAYTMSFNSVAKGINILGYYIYHGGRNPNFAPLQETRKTFFPNNLPILSYDFQAPISEFGYPRKSYYMIRLLHYFCTLFDENFAVKQSVFLSEQNSSFSSSIRINHADEGYCFINTYERGDLSCKCENFAPTITTKKGEISLPCISISNGENFFYPFNLNIGNVKFDYITAQPVLKFNSDGVINYIFLKHKDVDVRYKADKLVNGVKEGIIENFNTESLKIKDKELHVISVYTLDELLKLNYINGKIYKSEGVVYEDLDGVCELLESSTDLSSIINLEQIKDTNCKYDKYFYGKYKTNTYKLTVDKKILSKYYDIKLSIASNCDMAHIYCGDKIVGDYINYENNFTIYLNRFKAHIESGLPLIIKTSAIKPNQFTYFEKEMVTGDSSIKIAKVIPVIKSKI